MSDKTVENPQGITAKDEATTIALTMIERIGLESPVSLLSSDQHLLRYFCEFLRTDELVEGIAKARTPQEINDAFIACCWWTFCNC